jgi:tRNA (mo5U34)-methyltransferase
MISNNDTSSYSREQLQSLADSVDFWWHSIEFGPGVVTKGHKTPEILGRELASMRLPNLQGKTVLDIGAWDGFFSFAAERLGAQRVLALDHHVWSHDIARQVKYLQECKKRGEAPVYGEGAPTWQPERLPGKRGFDTAHNALNSNVECMVADFMNADLDQVGVFDIVFFLGVLYHMQDPLGALKRVAAMTRDLAIIETQAIAVPGYEQLEIVEFYSAAQLNADPSNWWAPNREALKGMCLAAGFRRVEVALTDSFTPASGMRAVRQKLGRGLNWAIDYARGRRQLMRVVAHAWK